jgi:hypothetical protein
MAASGFGACPLASASIKIKADRNERYSIQAIGIKDIAAPEEICQSYSQTVLLYMISRFEYPAGRPFYKRFGYHLSKLRRKNASLHAKIIDHTREFIPALPIGFHEVELWVEKDAIRMVSEHLAAKYRVSIQVLRGFPSITMLRKALARATKRGVQKILYVGDYDPSGVHIEHVAAREMGIEMQRVAITPEQACRYRLPAIKVNKRDSRANGYIKKNGDKAWELEALRPETFRKILEDALKANVPKEFLRKAKEREKAIKIAQPIISKFSRKLERQIIQMLKAKKSRREIRKIIMTRFNQGRK